MHNGLKLSRQQVQIQMPESYMANEWDVLNCKVTQQRHKYDAPAEEQPAEGYRNWQTVCRRCTSASVQILHPAWPGTNLRRRQPGKHLPDSHTTY
jgi:hypothetical protein